MFSPTEESISRLRRSGWIVRESRWTDWDGQTVHQVNGHNGENKILVIGPTPSEAWWRACEAAAAVGMLEGWPRP
jgi:hypothetical protein